MSQTSNLRMTVFAALFTALIIIGGYLSFPIPFSPVPIALADFFVMLAGLCLGTIWGAASVGLFLFLGLLGLPVFVGGKAGLAVFLGPTGGFLIGYLAGGLVMGLSAGKGKFIFLKDLLALIAGNVLIFTFGIAWLKLILKISWGKALILGLIPFIAGNAIKIVAALAVIQVIRPFFKQVISDSAPERSIE